MTISPNTEGRFGPLEECDVFWGSHGCHLKYGHDGPCVCGDEEGPCMPAPASSPAWFFFGADAEAAWVIGVIGVFLCAVLTVVSCGLLAVMADDSMRPEGFWYGVGVSVGIGGVLLFPCLTVGVAYLVSEAVERARRG